MSMYIKSMCLFIFAQYIQDTWHHNLRTTRTYNGMTMRFPDAPGKTAEKHLYIYLCIRLRPQKRQWQIGHIQFAWLVLRQSVPKVTRQANALASANFVRRRSTDKPPPLTQALTYLIRKPVAVWQQRRRRHAGRTARAQFHSARTQIHANVRTHITNAFERGPSA